MMRIKILYILLLAVIAFPLYITAREKNTATKTTREVSIVATGEGETKEIAIRNAQLSALEQAFGAYVSSNTSILNDVLIRDDIFSLNYGNVKSYEILSAGVNDSKMQSVIIEVVVSIDSLIEFAKNNGSECELATEMFSNNLALYKMRLKSGVEAMSQLYITLRDLASRIYDFKLQVGEPIVYSGDVYYIMDIQCTPNENYKAFYDYYTQTFQAVQNSISSSNIRNANKTEELSQIESLDSKIHELVKIWRVGFEISDNIGNKIVPMLYDEWNQRKGLYPLPAKNVIINKTWKANKNQLIRTHQLLEVNSLPCYLYNQFDKGMMIQYFSDSPICSFRGDKIKTSNMYGDYDFQRNNYEINNHDLKQFSDEFRKKERLSNPYDMRHVMLTDFMVDYKNQHRAYYNGKTYILDDNGKVLSEVDSNSPKYEKRHYRQFIHDPYGNQEWLREDFVGIKHPISSVVFYACYSVEDAMKVSKFKVEPISN